MTLPRSKCFREGEEGVYHCFSRCVRRAFLYGNDVMTGRDFSHRKVWLVDRLKYLAAIFAIEVCAYAIMENHHHTILRTRPDIVASWSNRDVAIRWLTLFPRRDGLKGGESPSEQQICALVDCPERIAELRRRLSSISWFMGRLNEFIARAANKEDGVKGRFWESRFKCQALLDDAAIVTGMVYVDLNPIRAGMAETPEESDYTSIQERIRAWSKEMSSESVQNTPCPLSLEISEQEEIASAVPERIQADSPAVRIPSASWLCPIQSNSQRRGILQMTEAQYFDLVDRSGRILRKDKRGAIDPDLTPILLRIGANPKEWHNTICHFGSRFRLAAGLLSNLRNFAEQISRRWLSGFSMARVSFCDSSSQPS